MAFYSKHRKVLDAMCELESGCQPLDAAVDKDGTGQLSCGYFQLKQNYYKEAEEMSNTPGYNNLRQSGGWEQCAKNRDWSIKCIENYMRRYGPMAYGIQNPADLSGEQIARLHNGGPGGGYNSPKAYDYWEKVKKRMN